MPWLAGASRMRHYLKGGNRLPWPVTTPQIDEINENNPEGDRDYR
jgi:hypothetical protein